MQTYDDIIIGAGQAGPPLAEKLGKTGRRVVLFERDLVGGCCVNRGCIPTKTLVASARAAHMARRSSDFGVVTSDVSVDMERVHERMARISEESRKGVESWLDEMENVTFIRGEARFIDERTVRVGDETYEAERVFINVGGRPRRLELPGCDQVDVLTNREMLELTELPEHLIILGGGYIGLEFGQMFRRFGSRVTIVEHGDRLIKREDEDVSDAVRQILESEDIDVLLNLAATRLEPDDDGVLVHLEGDAETQILRGSHVLAAAGRLPNTESLGCEAAGVEIDERGYIIVDDKLATSAPGVWALGDCHGKGGFTHTSWDDHQILAANLIDEGDRSLDDRFLCYGLFIDPPLGRAGHTEQSARDAGHNIRVGKRPMSRVGRARERSETQGFMKIVVDDDTEQILGASFLGINSDEVVHVILEAMYAGAPYTDVRGATFIHPTVSELIPTILQDI